MLQIGGDDMRSLSGKYLSLPGASTSTFDGFSNCEIYNTTIKQNAPYYPKAEWLNLSSDHWWKRCVARL